MASNGISLFIVLAVFAASSNVFASDIRVGMKSSEISQEQMQDYWPVLRIQAPGDMGTGLFYAKVSEGPAYEKKFTGDFIALMKQGENDWFVHDVFTSFELSKGRTLIEMKGYKVIQLSATDMSELGGTVKIRLLKDATNVVRGKYTSVSVQLTFENGYAVTKINDLYFDEIRIVPRSIMGKTVGISQLVFCDYSCDDRGPVYVSYL